MIGSTSVGPTGRVEYDGIVLEDRAEDSREILVYCKDILPLAQGSIVPTNQQQRVKTIDKDGWCINTYSVSKMIINTYARILSLRKEIDNNDISVYAAHPGWVKTDMTGPEAPLTIEEGVVNEIFLIELPDGINKNYQGKYFDNCKVASFE